MKRRWSKSKVKKTPPRNIKITERNKKQSCPGIACDEPHINGVIIVYDWTEMIFSLARLIIKNYEQLTSEQKGRADDSTQEKRATNPYLGAALPLAS